MSPIATREVHALSRNASDTEFPPPPVRLASPSGYPRPLRLQTGLMGSLQQSASFRAPLAPPSALVASGSAMSSSFPTSTILLVALSPALCLGSSRCRSKAFNESFQTNPGASREVYWMFRYALNSHLVPSPAHFASSSGYSQPLWTQNTYPESPRQSASIGAALKSPSALVALERTMFSSPTSAFCLVASLPELRLERSLYILKALIQSFPTSPGATR